MQGINKTIFYRAQSELNDYGLSDNDEDLLKLFLSTDNGHSQTRNDLAIELTKRILSNHGKNEPLLKGLISLAEIEKHIISLQEHARDHVAHAVSTFLLGIYLTKELHLGISKLEWKLCGLLHDIGYPFEMALNLPKKYEEAINKFGKNIHIVSPPLKSQWKFQNLEKLTDNKSSLQMITKRFRNWGLELSAGPLYRKMQTKGYVDHGIVSSLLVLKQIDMLYNQHNPHRQINIEQHNGVNWSYRHFKNNIVSACAAIFLHNLDKDLPSNRLDVNRHPLPFLLKFADELQDWDRPGNLKRTMYSADDYNINVSNGIIEFIFPRDRLEHFGALGRFFEGLHIEVDENASTIRCHKEMITPFSEEQFLIN